MLVHTEVVIEHLTQAQKDRMTQRLGMGGERYKLAALGMRAEDVFVSRGHAQLQAARFVWANSAEEFVRQGVDPVRVHQWVTQLGEFLSLEGPRPAPPVDAPALRAGQEYVEVDAPIEYSPTWWAALVAGLGRPHVV